MWLWPCTNSPCCPMTLNSNVDLNLSPVTLIASSHCVFFSNLSPPCLVLPKVLLSLIRILPYHKVHYPEENPLGSNLSLLRMYWIPTSSFIYVKLANGMKIKAVLHRLTLPSLCSSTLCLHCYCTVTFLHSKVCLLFYYMVNFQLLLVIDVCSKNIFEFIKKM